MIGAGDGAREVQAAAAAATHGVDWRPLLGVTPAMAGGLIERLLAWEVAGRVARMNNASGG